MIDLSATARALVAPGKGILAADESNDSADKKRLAPFGIETGPAMRQKFRDLFLAAPGVEAYLSGVILYSETLEQEAGDGTPFPKLLANRGILPGIKVDEGLEPLPGSPDETITKGLIGLPERLAQYRDAHGAAFTKWRAAIRIDGDRLPTPQALVENSKRLASYAVEAQKAGLVPIVEPEVLLEGSHSRMRAKAAVTDTLNALFAALADQHVDPSGLILKTSMVLSGSETKKMDAPEDVAQDTLDALIAAVPRGVAGVVFLSGGQSPDQATDNLAAITRRAAEIGAPWPLTYSYARAFQEEALSIWKGKPENVAAAREAFIARLTKASAALTAA